MNEPAAVTCSCICHGATARLVWAQDDPAADCGCTCPDGLDAYVRDMHELSCYGAVWPPAGVEPYYVDDAVCIVHGDCREVLPKLGPVDTVLTDPVWPNSVFPDIPNPAALFAEACKLLACRRLVVHLGCASDPRFLLAVPEALPYLRTCWLSYARPSCRGRILMGSDVAYVFGEPPASREGARVLPGEVIARNNSTKLFHSGRGNGTSRISDYEAMPHPAPRRLEHVTWLISFFSEPSDVILDPFAGLGTTLRAAKDLGRKAIGIEIEERYCEIAAERMAQAALPLAQPPAQALQPTLLAEGRS